MFVTIIALHAVGPVRGKDLCNQGLFYWLFIIIVVIKEARVNSDQAAAEILHGGRRSYQKESLRDVAGSKPLISEWHIKSVFEEKEKTKKSLAELKRWGKETQ